MMYFPRSLFLLLTLILFVIEVGAQSKKDSAYYSFILLKDGSKVAGKVILNDPSSITMIDFNLGEIHVKKTQIVKETDVLELHGYCFSLYTGQRYCGLVTYYDSLIYIRTESIGDIRLDPKKISEVQNASDVQIVNGEEWDPNPQPYRYFFLPSAIPMKKGEGYYQNIYLSLNTVNYGVSDHFSVGGGFLLPVGYMATFKYASSIGEKLYAGGGVIGGGSFFGGGDFIGAAYGMVTYGGNENNISLSAGYGGNSFFQNTWEFSRPVFTVSGMKRISKKFSLVTENWAFPLRQEHYHSNYPYPPTYTYTYNYNGVISFGMRTMWQKSAFDFALVLITGNDFAGDVTPIGIILPYVDYVLRF